MWHMEAMGLQGLIVLLLVGGVAGWLAALIVRGRGMGVLLNIVLGIVGALLAGILLPGFGFWPGGGILAAVVHATIGAVLLLLIVRLVKRA